MAQVVMAVAAVVGAGISMINASESRRARNEQAALMEKQARMDAEDREAERRRLLASQRAAYATAGVDVSEGSPLTVYAETNRIADEDIKNILSMGRIRSSVQSRMGRVESRSYTGAAVGSLLKGAGHVYTHFNTGQPTSTGKK